MSEQQILHSREGNEHFKEAVLIRDGYFIARYAVGQNGSVRGDILTSRPDASLQALFDLSLHDLDEGTSGFFGVSEVDLEPILKGEEEVPEAVREMFARHIPEDLLKLALVPSGVRFNERINYHLQGDREARAQIVMALPALRIHFQEAATGGLLRQLVDARKTPEPQLLKQLKISADDFKQLRRLTAIQSKAIRSGDASAWQVLDFRQLNGLSKFLTSNHVVKTLDDVKTVAYAVATNTAVSYQAVGGRMARKALRQAPLEEWPSVCENLRSVPSETADFKKSLTGAVGNAIAVHLLRSHAPEVFKVVNEVAPRIIDGEELESDIEMRAVQSFCETLDQTAYNRGFLRSAVDEVLGENFSLKKFREYSERWHHNQGRMREVAMSIPAEVSWEPMVGKAAAGGVSFRELCSNRDLEKQGRAQNNCVGGYTDVLIKATKDNIDLIFSVEEDGEILSTVRVEARLGWQEKNYSWSVGEHSAHSNNTPCAKARTAVKALIAQLEQIPARQVAAYGRSMMRKEGLPQRVAKIMQSQGANVFDPDLPEKLLAAHESVLPKRLRGLSPSEWIGVVAAMNVDLDLSEITSKFEKMEQQFLELKQKEESYEHQP